jgi:hypothetical protein
MHRTAWTLIGLSAPTSVIVTAGGGVLDRDSP